MVGQIRATCRSHAGAIQNERSSQVIATWGLFSSVYFELKHFCTSSFRCRPPACSPVHLAVKAKLAHADPVEYTMQNTKQFVHVDPALLAGWVAARSLARGLPQPVADRGGLRVDTGLPGEARRYVFPGPLPGISQIARSEVAPRTFIKMCGSGDELLGLVTPPWRLQPPAYFMCHEGAFGSSPKLRDGYRLQVSIEHAVAVARILAEDGSLAASAHAAEYAGVFVFDRIQTAPAHRRRGLATILMAALAATRKSNTARPVLVATEEGRALYSSLGWTTLSLYSTVAIGM